MMPLALLLMLKKISMPTCTFKYLFIHAILITVIAPRECDNGASLRLAMIILTIVHLQQLQKQGWISGCTG